MAFTAIPQLVVDFTTYDSDSRKVTYTIKEGDILKDVVYAADGVTLTKTGKVTAIMTAETKSSTTYGECACLLHSTFLNHVTVDGFVIDSSDVYDADTTMIFVEQLQSIGEVVSGELEVDIDKLPEGGLNAVLATAYPGQEVKLPAGEIKETLVIPEGVVVKGANAGTGASKGYRAQANVEGETVLAAPLTVANNVVIDGVTLSDTAKMNVTKSSNVVVKNTRIAGIQSSESKAMLIDGAADNEVLLQISNCYFGENVSNVFHVLEGNFKLQSGSYINNCYFAEATCRHNILNFYDVAENAIVTISGNVFEKSANAVRIGIKGDVACTFNLVGNTYKTTDSDVTLAGLVAIQPYGKITTSMKDVVINLTNTVNETNVEQLFVYYQSPVDVALDVANRPKIYINGTLADYTDHTIIDPPATA